MKTNDKRIVEPELSYTLMRIMFDVHNILGNFNQEKLYQKAIESELKRQRIQFEREKYVPVIFNDEIVGKYFLDFVVQDRIILEIKTVPYFQTAYTNQIYRYMKKLRIRLGILVNFRPPKLEYKRLILPDKYL